MYKSPKAMQREFMRRLGAHRFIALGDGLEAFKAFVEAFDISKAYSDQWWVENLKCRRPGEPLVFSKETMDLSFIRHQLHDLLSSFASYSLPTTDALLKIKEFVGQQVIHEHMAGSGYWAYHLSSMGVRIEAHDEPDKMFEVASAKKFVKVKRLAVESATLPLDCTLMLSWVPHGSNAPLRLLQSMRKGQRLIYIADWGCCGDKPMHDYIEENFDCVGHHAMPQLMEIRAGMWFYEKQNG